MSRVTHSEPGLPMGEFDQNFSKNSNARGGMGGFEIDRYIIPYYTKLADFVFPPRGKTRSGVEFGLGLSLEWVPFRSF